MRTFTIIVINSLNIYSKKAKIVDYFKNNKISNYFIFNSVNNKIDFNDPEINVFKKYSDFNLGTNEIIRLIDNYKIWNKLSLDSRNDFYVVLDDQVSFNGKLTNRLEKILMENPDKCDFLVIGTKNKHDNSNILLYNFQKVNSEKISNNIIGYIISKDIAKKIVYYAKNNGINTYMDNVIFNIKKDVNQLIPNMIFIEDSYKSIPNKPFNFELIKNYNIFPDYVFYPNKDSYGGDIKLLYADINVLKKIADSIDECVAFNTCGFLKNKISSTRNFSTIRNMYHLHDGIYVKKKYHQLNDTDNILKEKIKKIKKISSVRPVNVFINNYAKSYFTNYVSRILSLIKNYKIVAKTDNYDVSMNFIYDDHIYKDSSLNILFSGECDKTKYKYDISIDTYYNANARYVVHIPFAYTSVFDRRGKVEFNLNLPKTKFCAYMYSVSHPHRINYFKLLSRYKKVDALGKCCNNVNIKSTRTVRNEKETYNDIAVRYYSTYKFVLALENKNGLGYTTEKLINPLIAGSVPIYWGDSLIFNTINKKRVIYVNDFESDEKLLEYIKFVDKNDSVYKSIVKEKVFVNGVTLDSIFKDFYNQIDRLFDL
jgi:hypothetical protein